LGVFDHDFRVLVYGDWLIISGPVARQNIMVRACAGAKWLISWWTGGRRRRRGRGERE
jgi:hypothetical protein